MGGFGGKAATGGVIGGRGPPSHDQRRILAFAISPGRTIAGTPCSSDRLKAALAEVLAARFFSTGDRGRYAASGLTFCTFAARRGKELSGYNFGCMPLLELVNTFWDIGMDDEN